jgi:hypothetical protein
MLNLKKVRMTEQLTQTVKQEALDALRRARQSLGQEVYTAEQLYNTASSMSNLAPHFIRWAAEGEPTLLEEGEQ